MLRRRVNGYGTAHIEVGQGETLVCVHGSLCDFRVWSAVPGPLLRRHRVAALSLRRSFPERWDGVGGGSQCAVSQYIWRHRTVATQPCRSTGFAKPGSRPH
jgi:pimeloyl-ACP methyl ester carboxylesterase